MSRGSEREGGGGLEPSAPHPASVEPDPRSGRYGCAFCWATFESPVALLLHEAQEDDRLYEVDGLTDVQ